MAMDAPFRGWEKIALMVVLVIGLGTVTWLSLPHVSAPLQPLVWQDLLPARDVALRPWRWIVIHHSATPGGTAAGIDHEHRDIRGWEGIGYHLLIGNGRGTAEGRIEATFRWRGQETGAHAGPAPAQQPYNELGIGLCIIGDYRHSPPSPLVERRMVELCALLIRNCPNLSVASIIGHGEVPGKNTECPGGAVDLVRVRRLVGERLASEPR
jgi:hypothetical protein